MKIILRYWTSTAKMKKFPLGLIIYEEDIWGLQSDCATHNIGVEGVGDGAAELLT